MKKSVINLTQSRNTEGNKDGIQICIYACFFFDVWYYWRG